MGFSDDANAGLTYFDFDIFGNDPTYLDAKTAKTLTQAQADELYDDSGNGPCLFGLWENIAAAAGKSITSYYTETECHVNSMVELNRRDTSDNSVSRILMATYKVDRTDGFNVGKLIKLNTDGDTLTIESLTDLSDNIWAKGKPSWEIYQNRAFMVNGISDSIDAPGTAPTGASEGSYGVLPAGTYSIKYSYVRIDSDGGETESTLNTTAVSKTVTGSDNTIIVTVTYSTESYIDKLRIYRTKASGTTYYFDTEIDNDTNGGTTTVDVGVCLTDDELERENSGGQANRIWTDGTNVYQIGLDAPTVEPATPTGASGGQLTAGDYYIAYSYYRSTESTCESNILAYSSAVTVTGSQKITATVTASSDPQVTGIRLYRTKVGGAVYYLDATVDNTTASVSWGETLADDALTVAASNSGAGNDNDRPPESRLIALNANRMFYATQNYVYWSKSAYPEQVPSDNLREFDKDDGEQITNIAAFKKYIIVQKPTKTWIMDASYPEEVKPMVLSSNIGCIESNTFKVCLGGQIAIWLSQEGFYVTDGNEIKSITVDRIYRDLAKNIDKGNIAVARAIYYPNDAQYICYVPYLNSQYRIWVYTIPQDNWVQFEYPWRPHSVILWSDDNDIKRFCIGTVLSGVEDGRRSYFAHFMQADKDNHYKDALYCGTCGDDVGSETTTYQDITMTVITSWDNLGVNEFDKIFRSVHLEWFSNGETTATITVRSDYGRRTASATITHSGIENEPSESEWYLGYDYTVGWDYQQCESDVGKIPVGLVTGTSNPQEIQGRNVSIKFLESSDNEIKVYLFSLIYKLLGRRDD